jgi:hypothetical protein
MLVVTVFAVRVPHPLDSWPRGLSSDAMVGSVPVSFMVQCGRCRGGPAAELTFKCPSRYNVVTNVVCIVANSCAVHKQN